jgi:hypothetical protein
LLARPAGFLAYAETVVAEAHGPLCLIDTSAVCSGRCVEIWVQLFVLVCS